MICVFFTVKPKFCTRSLFQVEWKIFLFQFLSTQKPYEINNYRPQTTLGQDNVLTPVGQSFCSHEEGVSASRSRGVCLLLGLGVSASGSKGGVSASGSEGVYTHPWTQPSPPPLDTTLPPVEGLGRTCFTYLVLCTASCATKRIHSFRLSALEFFLLR